MANRCIACGFVDDWPAPTCPKCGLERPAELDMAGKRERTEQGGPLALSRFSAGDVARWKLPEPLGQLFGGGLARCASILCGGLPGSGKSSLALRLCHHVGARTALRVVYVSYEMGPQLLYATARRMSVDPRRILVWWDPELSDAAEWIEESRPALVIIDSLQRTGVGAAEGLRQVLDSCEIVGACAFLIAHSTKEDPIGGPQGLRHDVDCTLVLERDEKAVLGRVEKNRYGQAPITVDLSEEMTSACQSTPVRTAQGRETVRSAKATGARTARG
jgi:DNA repair protein RadA/Sms